jgi:hypothetical protein
MSIPAAVDPLFESTRAAIRFALNHQQSLPSPVMSRVMVARSRLKLIELADGRKIEVTVRKGRAKDDQLKGLDGSAQAGMILQAVSRLTHAQQLVVIVRSTPASITCSCRRPCCRGRRPNPQWTEPVEFLCEYLRTEAKLSKVKGKRGLSTPPMLRRLLVEKHFLPGREMTLVEIARTFDITEATVIQHQKPIRAWLESQEGHAWRALDARMSASGIVGFLA